METISKVIALGRTQQRSESRHSSSAMSEPVDLQLAKKLRASGFPQEAGYWWVQSWFDFWFLRAAGMKGIYKDSVAAPTVAQAREWYMTAAVSLQLARSLEEAGFPQESFFWWVYRNGDWRLVLQDDLSFNEIGLAIAAPTVEQILRQLPMFIKKDGRTSQFELASYDAETAGYAWLALKAR